MTDAPLRVLSAIGPYKVIRLLGEGGMGRVFLAQDPALDREVAVKVIRDDVVTDPEANKRFVREARAMAKLSSPHVVTIFQVGTVEESGAPYLVMERLSGADLEQHIQKRGALPPAEVARLGAEAAAGLLAAANANVVHRDVKPANLLLDVGADGVLHLKLTDFGLARPQAGTDSKLTKDGVVVGSPFWLAPELVQGVSATHASDVYSLGATLYQCLTGHVPYERETPVAVVMAHAQDPIPDVTGPLGPVIQQMLAKDPAARPSLGDVQRRLTDLHAQLSSTVALEGTAATETMEAVTDNQLRPSTEAAPSSPAVQKVEMTADRPLGDDENKAGGRRALPKWALWAAGGFGLLIVGSILLIVGAGVLFSRFDAATFPEEAKAIERLLDGETCAERKRGLQDLVKHGKSNAAPFALDKAAARDVPGCIAQSQIDLAHRAIAARRKR